MFRQRNQGIDLVRNCKFTKTSGSVVAKYVVNILVLGNSALVLSSA